MTLSPETLRPGEQRCRWCGRRFQLASGPGRPREYCRPSHRQRAYEARRLATDHRLQPDQVLMARARLDHIRDFVYRIEAAMDDVDTDVGEDGTEAGTRQALWHLYRACGDARTIVLEPLATGS